MNQQTLPGASDALTFGILSIVLTVFCCGPFGAIFGFLGLNRANRAEQIYQTDKERSYSGYDNVKTGRILSYIGLGIALIYLIFTIIYFGAIVAFIMASGAFQ